MPVKTGRIAFGSIPRKNSTFLKMEGLNLALAEILHKKLSSCAMPIHTGLSHHQNSTIVGKMVDSYTVPCISQSLLRMCVVIFWYFNVHYPPCITAFKSTVDNVGAMMSF